MQHWVKEQVIAHLNPLLAPDYEVKDYERQLRLTPTSQEGVASRFADNDAYHKARLKIPQVLDHLDKIYRAKEESLKMHNKSP